MKANQAMIYRTALIVSMVLVAPANKVAIGQITSAKIDQVSVSVGDNITMTVAGKGKFLVENDIAKTSSQHDVNGKKTISPGKISAPGLYAFNILDGSQKPLVLGVFAGLAKPDQLSLSSRSARVEKSEQIDADTLNKFWKEASKVRLLKALEKAFPKWIATNPAALGTTTVICTLCLAPNPSSTVACPVCVESAAGNGVDLLLDVVKELIEKNASILNKEEAARLSKLVGIGKSMGAIVSVGSRAELALETVAAAAEFKLQGRVAEAVVMNSKDEISKTYVLIKILGK